MKIFGLQIKLNINYKKVVNGLFQSAEYQNVRLEMESSINNHYFSKKINKKNTKGSYINFKKNKTKTNKLCFFHLIHTQSVSQRVFMGNEISQKGF